MVEICLTTCRKTHTSQGFYHGAESSKVAYNCDGCGYEIYIGEMMGIFSGRIYCSDCIEDRVREVTNKDLAEERDRRRRAAGIRREQAPALQMKPM